MRNAPWESLLLLLIVTVPLHRNAFAVDPATEPPIPASLDEIIEGLERREKSFFDNESLIIRYERTNANDVMVSNASGGGLLAEWTLAYRGLKWFTERRFTQPAKTETFVVEAEPMTQVSKDGMILEWRQANQQVVVDKVELGRNFYGGLLYTRNLSLDAPRYIAKAIGANIADVRKQYPDDADLPFLPGFLRNNKSKYRVLPAREEVDGAPCWVVEWVGMDRFCVDPARGFAIPRRAYAWAPGKPLRFEFLQSDYQEVKSGLWLPFKQVENYYANIIAEDPKIWGKVTARYEYRLRSVEFNRVPDSLFSPEIPEGTRVLDLVRDFKYVVSGKNDTNPFSATVAEAARQAIGTRPPLKKSASAGRLLFVLLNGLIFIALITSWLYMRFWRRKVN